MTDTYTNTAMPGLPWTVLCDDDNVQHCPTVAKLPGGGYALSSTLQPGTALVLTGAEMNTLLRQADAIRTLQA